MPCRYLLNHQLPITNYQSPITNHQLPITNHQLPITNHQLPITLPNMYCINPKCKNFTNPVNTNEKYCYNCGIPMLSQGRYRAIQPLNRGSFGQTFEVEDIDSRDGDTQKVLKVLLTDCDRAIALFQREADVLKQLNHPGIPRVEPDGYFTVSVPDSDSLLHCLVMAKIEGINLKDWLSDRQDQPITCEQAIDWLKQLTQILAVLHQRNFWHRDIKPSNIMLRPNGQLVLIDFGAVKEVTKTYLYSLQHNSGTVIISPGYTPPEQARGQPSQYSDFYALGRTFIHLLTGKHPLNIEDSQTVQFNWRTDVPKISKKLAILLDEMMDESPCKRPQNIQKIRQRLWEIEHPHRARLNKVMQVGIGTSAILVIIVGFVYKITASCPVQFKDNLSCGEESLLTTPAPPEKQKGLAELGKNNPKGAIILLETALKKKPNDPESLIYLNNAKLAGQPTYTIAVAVPIDKNPFTAKEILWGVALAQNEINQGQKINGKGLKVEIANDANKPEQAARIANKLVLQRELLAVVGHYASEVTRSTLEIYQRHQLLLISPTSTSGALSQHPFFLRTVPSDRLYAQTLVQYLINQKHQTKAAVFYNPQSNYSQSIRDRFQVNYKGTGGQIVAEFDLSNPEFNADEAINQAQNQGAKVLVLLPDGRTNEFVFNNTLNLVEANQCRYPMVGGDSVYSKDFLTLKATNCLVIAIPWHEWSSLNLQFPKMARKLGAKDVTWRTALTYDATRVLITALEKNPTPSRYLVHKALKESTFQTRGATGEITFHPDGNRKETIRELVKVVKVNCPNYNYVFSPLTMSNERIEKLACSGNW